MRVPAVSVQTQRQSLRGNHILAAMPKTETVDMPLGQVVFEPGGELQHAYFPLSAIVSLLCGVNNGESAEIALVGNDGVLGVSVLMGGNATTVGAVVQSAGQGWRLPARELEAEVRRGDEMVMTRMARAGPATPCCTSVRRTAETELQALVDNAGVLAGFDCEIALLRRCIALAKEGHRWLLVKVDDANHATAACGVARACGATLAVY